MFCVDKSVEIILVHFSDVTVTLTVRVTGQAYNNKPVLLQRCYRVDFMSFVGEGFQSVHALKGVIHYIYFMVPVNRHSSIKCCILILSVK
jgi:hypothetical protein